MGPEILILVGSIVVALLVLVVGVFATRRSQALVDQRLGTLAAQNTYEPIIATDELEDDESSRRDRRQLTRRLDKSLEGGKFGKKWRLQLARADLRLTIGEFFVAQFLSMAGFFAAAFFIIFRGDPDPVDPRRRPRIFLPPHPRRAAYQQAPDHVREPLADTLGLWVNALRSGYSVPQAMDAIGRDSPEPTKTEFKRVVQEMQLGIPLQEAFNHMLERVESEDLDLVVTAVNIQREVGGNLSEILDVIQNTVRERIKLKGEIRVMTSQGRYTGYLISFLPIGLGFLLRAMNPAYMNQMFEDRGCGWPMIGIGLALIGIGSAAIQKIVDIDI
ncbi:MAG: secretion system protein [Chloroflexi bacterium]|nr:secretion system protein [Chloroflexota bacterium]